MKKHINYVSRQHPAAVLRYTTKNFWMLLIPAVRALIAYSFDIREWMRVMSFDIIVIVFMFVQAVFHWYLITFEVTEKCFRYHCGFIYRMTSEIPYERISAVTVEKYFTQKPIGCAFVLIDTDAQALEMSKTSPDIKLIMRDADIDRLFHELTIRNKDKQLFRDNISKRALVVFSLFFSSALSGVALIAAMLVRSGNIIGNTLEKIFMDALNTAAENVSNSLRTVIMSIPPAAAGAALIVVLGWFISFLTNLLRHMNFTIEKRGKGIIIRDGSLIKRKYYISADHINYADLRQSLLMMLFGIMSVNVNCSGYGKGKNEIPVFIPVSDKKKVRGIMKRIIPGYEIEESTAEAGVRFVWRYTCIPSLSIIGLIFAAGAAILFFPAWYDMIFFGWIMLEIPLVWLLFAKTAAYCTGGIFFNGRIMSIRYNKLYEFHTVMVPKERISKVTLSRSFFQRMNNSCDILIYTYSEYTRCHRVRGIVMEEAENIIREYLKPPASEAICENDGASEKEAKSDEEQ